MGIISSLWNGVKRVAKVTPDYVFGTSAEVAGKAMRETKGSIFIKADAGFKALEQDAATRAAKDGNLLKRTVKTLSPNAIAADYKEGVAVAKTAAKTAKKSIGPIRSAIKGGFSVLGKRMPLIGAVLTLVFEAPNAAKAFSEGGVVAGAKEVVGVGVELGCMATGAAIGSAIAPGLGTVLGGLVGSVVGMFVRGDTYTEKQEALAEEAEAEEEAIKKYFEENTLEGKNVSGGVGEEQNAVQTASYTNPYPQTNSQPYINMYNPFDYQKEENEFEKILNRHNNNVFRYVG